MAIRRKIMLPIAHNLIQVKSSDSCTVSFPRSGSTWLRTILANLIKPEAKGDPMVFNALLPSVSVRNLPKIWKAPHPRIIQTHTTYRKDISKAVYVVRDGRDSIVSFYHYCITRQGKHLSFSDWFNLYNQGWFGKPWHIHVESWLIQGKNDLGDNLLCVRFEDLKSDTFNHIQKISNFLNIAHTPGLIEHPIDMASIEQSKKWEEHYLGKPNNANASFYRGGKSSQWAEYLSGELYSKFMENSAIALELAGYPDAT